MMNVDTLLCLAALLLQPAAVASFSSIAVAAPLPKGQTFIDDATKKNLKFDDAAAAPASAFLAKKKVTASAAGTYESALSLIDNCAVTEKSAEGLYEAARLIERDAHKFYSDMSDKEALWERAQGSWKLILSTRNPKARFFQSPSYNFPFSFAMISGDYFGNGFGINEKMVFVSVLQKHYFNPKIRQMVVTVKDIYLGGRKATDLFPAFIKDAINLGKTPEDFAEERIRAPAFTLVCATENALVARGNISGAIVIWKRLKEDLKPIAYKDL